MAVSPRSQNEKGGAPAFTTLVENDRSDIVCVCEANFQPPLNNTVLFRWYLTEKIVERM